MSAGVEQHAVGGRSTRSMGTVTALVVNADDLGLTPGINEGIFRAWDHGIVTSASLMVCRPHADAAVSGARERPELGLGLHLDLGSWVQRDGCWVESERPVDLSDEAAVRNEVERQAERFRQMVGRPPTHLDSHQHIHLGADASAPVAALADRLRVPLRGVTPGISYEGGFYAQDRHGASHPDWVSVPSLVRILRGLGPGVTEIACHPGLSGDAPDAYRSERSLELLTLVSPDVRRSIDDLDLQLCSFARCGFPGGRP